MSKKKPKKPCEFEVMAAVFQILKDFSAADRIRIMQGVDAKLDGLPAAVKRGRKPKSNSFELYQEGTR